MQYACYGYRYRYCYCYCIAFHCIVLYCIAWRHTLRPTPGERRGAAFTAHLPTQVFDHDRITRDDSLGSAAVDLTRLRQAREVEVEKPLSSKGTVSLVLTWTPRGHTAPPPDPALAVLGTLQVRLKGASGLRGADLNGLSDPYAVLTLRGVKHKSKTISKSLNPRWDETFSFEGSLGELTDQPMQLEVLCCLQC